MVAPREKELSIETACVGALGAAQQGLTANDLSPIRDLDMSVAHQTGSFCQYRYSSSLVIMFNPLRVFGDTWRLLDPTQRRNMMFYVLGIMFYKLGVEAFNGSVVALATNRYDWEHTRATAEGRTAAINTFQRVGLLQALNQTAQCLGAIMIAPLIKRFPCRSVLGCAIFAFGLFASLLMVLDVATGGKVRPASAKKDDWGTYYGTYPTDMIIPIYTINGLAYGMVEIIRRVIPRDIVGGDIQKLRRMDSLVHIFYETAGTAGAFLTALVLIPALGNNMSFCITPAASTLAAVCWLMISPLEFVSASKAPVAGSRHPLARIATHSWQMLQAIGLFFESMTVGARLLFTQRRFIWLVPGYALALYGHRYLENGLAPIVARRYLGQSAWSQIMVGGSNFGELLGALSVFLFTNAVRTPMPWLRMDALLLLIVWYIPFWRPASIPGSSPPAWNVGHAWMVAATFVPISFGWAAGDCSLAAYIQALLTRCERRNNDVSQLGAVMAFLYSLYIILYAIMNPMLGRYIDTVDAASRKATGAEYGDVRPAVTFIAGVQFTVLAVIIVAATFVPKGALKWNPTLLNGQDLEEDFKQSDMATDDEKGNEMAMGDYHDIHLERYAFQQSVTYGAGRVPGFGPEVEIRGPSR